MQPPSLEKVIQEQTDKEVNIKRPNKIFESAPNGHKN